MAREAGAWSVGLEKEKGSSGRRVAVGGGGRHRDGRERVAARPRSENGERGRHRDLRDLLLAPTPRSEETGKRLGFECDGPSRRRRDRVRVGRERE